MRLGVKIFLATSLVIVLMVAVAGWSLLTVRQLAAGQHALVARAVPALQLEGALRLSMQGLTRLEGRYAVIGDAVYAKLWRTRADRTAEDLKALGGRPASPDQRPAHGRDRPAYA